MKNILLLVHDDCGQQARLCAALDVMAAVKGHLTCLDLVAALQPIYRVAAAPVAGLLLEQERMGEYRNALRLRPELAARAIPFSWVNASGQIARTLGHHAGLADLVVLSTLFPIEYPDMHTVIRALLRQANTPILAVPMQAEGFVADGRSVVLWDGSPDAKAALRAAIPLLKLAERVTILHVEDGSLAEPVAHAEAYLALHGIVSYPSLRASIGGTSRVIGRYIAHHDPAYVVMGGFAHGRFHEAVFGSVTRHLLATTTVPLLLSRSPR